MEMEQFDVFTRHLSGAGSSRRYVLRSLGSVLLGGALAGVAARLGLVAGAEAKAKGKMRKAKPKQKRPSQAERKPQGQLQAEGKRKGKGKGKPGNGKPKPRPNPVCDNGLPRCPDGSCRQPDQCCPGSRRCADGVCTRDDQCCSGEWQCNDRSCVAQGECCPDEQKCPGGECVPWDNCCPGRKRCPDGSCIPNDHCCPDAIPPLCTDCQEAVCEDGEYVCRPTTPPYGTCSSACEEAVCDDGTWTCQFKASNCPECPAGSVSCPPLWRYERGRWCCPEDRYFPVQGRPFCTENIGHGGGVYCDSPTGD